MNAHNPSKLLPYVTVRQAIDDLRAIDDDKDLSHLRTKNSPEFLAKIKATPIGKSVGGYSEAFHRSEPDQPSSTVKANNGSVFVHYAEDRLMTPRELARLQGFPDSHKFSGNKRDVLIQIGNAVAVQMAGVFAQTIKATLRGTAATEKPHTTPALPPALTFRDAVGDLPEQASQTGETCAYTSAPQNDFQRQMRGTATVVTEHTAPHHGEKMLALMSFIPEGKSAQDSDVYSTIPEHLRPGRSFSNSYARIKRDQPTPTITRNSGTPSSANCIHPSEPRALTIREAARCQSFPDDFEFIGTTGEIRQLISNAVPPLLAEALARALRHGENSNHYKPGDQQCTQSQQAASSAASGGSTSASSAPASNPSGKSNATGVASTSSAATFHTRRASRMSSRLGRTTCRRSISSTAGSRVPISAARDSAKAWLEREVDSGDRSTELLASLNRLLSSSKTFVDFCPNLTAAISQQSFKGWGTAGIGGVTGCLTLNSSVSTNAAVASTLSQVLETGVAPKYFLNSKECQKLLRRHTTRPLHPILHLAVQNRLSSLQDPKCSTGEEYTTSV